MDKRHTRLLILGLIFSFSVMISTIVIAVIYKRPTEPTLDVGSEEIPAVSEDDITPVLEVSPTLTKVDFQPVVDDWVGSVKGNRSVLIYDLDNEEVVGQYNAKEAYNTASLYKLFVVYEGYKRVYDEIWSLNAPAGATGQTIQECLKNAISLSDSVCAETLWGLIGRQTLVTIMGQDWKITDSDLSNLISNPTDILKIMKRFYEHPDFDDPNLVSMMWDSFLNQPSTEYNWRQGLPSGFSKASVYNKVGWEYEPDEKYWKIYHDAAIVKFALEDGSTRNYIIIVMTNRVDYMNIRNFGKAIEKEFYNHFS